MNVVDLAPFLEEDAGPNPPHTLLCGDHVTTELIVLAAESGWEATHSVTTERTLLGLEGNATAQIDGARHTLPSGFLLHIPQGASLSLQNEEKEPYRALLTSAELPPAMSAAENGE